MGAIADAFVAYAQPLIDMTDGSQEQLNKAMAITQLCWNLALQPEDEQEQLLSDVRPGLHMDEDEFNEFRASVLVPMIQRHREMFPLLHQRGPIAPSPFDPFPPPVARATGEAYPGAQPYEPCPCNSGRKYKFCCRKKNSAR